MIALLFATPKEASIVSPPLPEPVSCDSPRHMRLQRSEFAGEEVIVLTCGVGKVAAAAGTMLLLERYRPWVLLVCGTAGALTPRTGAGDLVLSTALLPGDVGVAHSGGFGNTGPGVYEEGRVAFSPTFTSPHWLLELAADAARAAGLPFHLGPVLTCDQVVLDPELRSHLGEVFQALAVEMEGAAAAQVAMQADVPCMAVRAISDELGHDFVGMEKLLRYRGQSRRNLWEKRFHLSVSDPGVISRAQELLRGRDLALANLGRFLETFLPLLCGRGPEDTDAVSTHADT
ncbi:MAG: 5'-methylthioadenosine/S-adenosylhomocysteine nucleosidase [Actinobacteria bacterium]|nr:5'-methylthioadenosine/S-adenosylhomocysteine nucleosidase [Actinomycetota bacterium]